ncbi:Nat2 protein [Maudiozyma humilis]|uniref:Nat2 protein n=1 Tax=Maudiozyma humilis TaxID=51915 RepID=A0AAV5RYG3_MAUHU|nr:Nat2 protein [Kazachstania humilis]
MLSILRLPRVRSSTFIHALKARRSVGLPPLKRSFTKSSQRFTETAGKEVAQKAKPETGIKKLMKTYGYSALVVYIGVTFISLPLCFFTVHSMGAEKISVYLNRGKQLFGYGEETDEAVIEKIKLKEKELEEQRKLGEHTKWQEFKQSTLLAEFLIAYGLHKSLVFVRIPVTAAVTPTMARVFKRWGWTRLTGGSSIMNKSDILPKVGPNGEFPRQSNRKSRKWFNGLM